MLSPNSWKDKGLVVNGRDLPCTVVIAPFAKVKQFIELWSNDNMFILGPA